MHKVSTQASRLLMLVIWFCFEHGPTAQRQPFIHLNDGRSVHIDIVDGSVHSLVYTRCSRRNKQPMCRERRKYCTSSCSHRHTWVKYLTCSQYLNMTRLRNDVNRIVIIDNTTSERMSCDLIVWHLVT